MALVHVTLADVVAALRKHGVADRKIPEVVNKIKRLDLSPQVRNLHDVEINKSDIGPRISEANTRLNITGVLLLIVFVLLIIAVKLSR